MAKKTIILHDTFLYKGGGERLIIMMAKSLGADIASGFFSKGSFDLREAGFQGKMIQISSEIFKKGWRHIQLKKDFMFKTSFLNTYDRVIFSGDSISAVRQVKNNKNVKKIYYCHTPPRYLYDLKSLYYKKVPLLLKPFFLFASYIFRKMYENDIRSMDLILTNSKNTQKRIKEFLGYDAKILYPPVDLNEFKFLGQKNYYLSCARLSDAKRVDRIVEAFKKMPEKKLIITYGKNDPQREKIFQIARGSENIEFVTLEGNGGFTDYVGNCIASIYIPIDEDFGMTPVEAMSAGKPVLGVNEGGLKESIINGKTGILISPSAVIEDIIDAVKYLSPEVALSMRDNCEARAEDFSLDAFQKQLFDLIK